MECEPPLPLSVLEVLSDTLGFPWIETAPPPPSNQTLHKNNTPQCATSSKVTYRRLPDDGDVAVVDEPPARVLQAGLEAELLQHQDADAQHGQHADDGEGDQQSQQEDI